MATVMITGGTGLIGRALTDELIEKGYKVIILTRHKPKQSAANFVYLEWDIQKQVIDPAAIKQADYVVHLAGANVGEARWTEKRKKEIVDSRIQSAALLVKALNEIPNQVKAVISSSAIGWYGPDPQVPNPQPFKEAGQPDPSFLGQTCKLWEESINPVIELGKRLVKLRTGIVLSREGGAFKEFERPLTFGVASILGNGSQIVSWIHIKDIVGMYLYAIENENLQGVFNAVAPNPVSNKTLMLTMAKAKGGKMPVKVPEFALKLAFGEMSVEVLKSTTVSSQKIEAAGYSFLFPSIEAAVNNLLR